MTFGLVLLKTEMVAVLVDVLEDMMILMSLEPPFLPVEGHRVGPVVGWGQLLRLLRLLV